MCLIFTLIHPKILYLPLNFDDINLKGIWGLRDKTEHVSWFLNDTQVTQLKQIAYIENSKKCLCFWLGPYLFMLSGFLVQELKQPKTILWNLKFFAISNDTYICFIHLLIY